MGFHADSTWVARSVARRSAGSRALRDELQRMPHRAVRAKRADAAGEEPLTGS